MGRLAPCCMIASNRPWQAPGQLHPSTITKEPPGPVADGSLLGPPNTRAYGASSPPRRISGKSCHFFFKPAYHKSGMLRERHPVAGRRVSLVRRVRMRCDETRRPPATVLFTSIRPHHGHWHACILPETGYASEKPAEPTWASPRFRLSGGDDSCNDWNPLQHDGPNGPASSQGPKSRGNTPLSAWIRCRDLRSWGGCNPTITQAGAILLGGCTHPTRSTSGLPGTDSHRLLPNEVRQT
jgi:hypothetical protein